MRTVFSMAPFTFSFTISDAIFHLIQGKSSDLLFCSLLFQFFDEGSLANVTQTLGIFSCSNAFCFCFKGLLFRSYTCCGWIITWVRYAYCRLLNAEGPTNWYLRGRDGALHSLCRLFSASIQFSANMFSEQKKVIWYDYLNHESLPRNEVKAIWLV